MAARHKATLARALRRVASILSLAIDNVEDPDGFRLCIVEASELIELLRSYSDHDSSTDRVAYQVTELLERKDDTP